MNLILIKIGKAWSVIKREGIFRGGKRVLEGFFSIFNFVGSGDVLFITGGVVAGDSTRFRVLNVMEELEAQGFHCSRTVQDNPFLAGYAKKFKIFIFHRVLFTPNVSKLIDEIKSQNREIIFETDDLVFDPQYLPYMDYFQKMNSLERKMYENGVGGEILVDPYVKVCTTTTSYLAKKLEEKNKRVFIIPNKLSISDLKIAEEILAAEATKKDETVRLGYFSGTASHNKDFATITEALYQIMQKYEKLELFLAGPLDIENKLNDFKNRIKQISHVPREKHFANIFSVDINLAPLEINNPFCEAKSELKFFEAGIVMVPTVAVKNQTFSEAISDGVDGLLALETQEWVEKLSLLIESKEMRDAIGNKAYEKSLEKYTTKNSHNQEYYNYLKAKL